MQIKLSSLKLIPLQYRYMSASLTQPNGVEPEQEKTKLREHFHFSSTSNRKLYPSSVRACRSVLSGRKFMAADGNFSNRPPKFGGFQGVAFSACSHTHGIAHENVSVTVLKKGVENSVSSKNFPHFARVFGGKFNWKSLSLLNRNRTSRIE